MNRQHTYAFICGVALTGIPDLEGFIFDNEEVGFATLSIHTA